MSLFHNKIDKPLVIGSPETLEELQNLCKPKTKSDVAKEIKKDEEKLKKAKTTVSCLQTQVGDDELVEGDVVLHEEAFVIDEAKESAKKDDPDEALTDITGEVGEKRKHSGKSLATQLCEAYPSVKTTGVFLFVDEYDSILFADDDLNRQFLSAFLPK